MGETPTASEVAKACDKALADQDKVIDLKTKTITAQDEQIAAQKTDIAKLEKSQTGILSSPWFYVTVGILAGAFAFRSK